MTEDQESVYSFEKNNKRREGDQELFQDKFLERIGASDIKFTNDMKLNIREFVEEHHCAIQWYQQAIEKEEFRRGTTRFWTIALLLAIPAVLTAIPIIAAGHGKDTDPSVVTGMVTAGLTSLIAVVKSFNSWAKNRQTICEFWEASSKLKKSLYTFERRWQGKDITAEIGLFRTEIQEGQVAAQDILDQEQQAFFNKQKEADANLFDQLGTAQTAAAKLTQTFVKPGLDQSAKLAKQARKIETIKLKIDTYKSLMEKGENEADKANFRRDIALLEKSFIDERAKLLTGDF